MISTLILLYALDSAETIPQGCFIAAWVLTIIKNAGNAGIGNIDKPPLKRRFSYSPPLNSNNPYKKTMKILQKLLTYPVKEDIILN